MTVLIGWRTEDERSVIASDTATFVFDGNVRYGNTHKITTMGPLAIASAGCGRAYHVVRENARALLDAYSDKGIAGLARALRDAMAADGYRQGESGAISYDASFMVAAPCGLYPLGATFCYNPAPVGQALGMGSGGEMAVGAFAAAEYLRADPARSSDPPSDEDLFRLARIAISAAIQHVASTGGEVDTAIVSGKGIERRIASRLVLQPLPRLLVPPVLDPPPAPALLVPPPAPAQSVPPTVEAP